MNITIEYYNFPRKERLSFESENIKYIFNPNLDKQVYSKAVYDSYFGGHASFSKIIFTPPATEDFLKSWLEDSEKYGKRYSVFVIEYLGKYQLKSITKLEKLVPLDLVELDIYAQNKVRKEIIDRKPYLADAYTELRITWEKNPKDSWKRVIEWSDVRRF